MPFISICNYNVLHMGILRLRESNFCSEVATAREEQRWFPPSLGHGFKNLFTEHDIYLITLIIKM